MMDEPVNFYELLGVEEGANAGEIKAAFKRMALKYHPDVYPGPDAAERMRYLLAAYKTLSDPSKRRTYDLAHGIRRKSGRIEEEPFAFYRAPDGKGFTTQASGPLPTPSKATPAWGESGKVPAEEGKEPAKSEGNPPSHLTANKIAVTFPRLDAGVGAVIALEEFVYTLTMPQAGRLREDGRLLGADMPQRIVGSNGETGGRRCTCHRCGHGWVLPAERRRSSTDRCPKCAAPDWAEYLLLRCQECTAVFESQQIRRYDRVKIGERYYGDFHLCSPYELFPKCPNCEAVRWCAGEELRLNGRRSGPSRQTSGPLPQTTGPRASVSGSFPRVSASGHTGAFASVRPARSARRTPR